MVTKSELWELVGPRLTHPLIRHYYLEFERLGMVDLYLDLLHTIPTSMQAPLVHIYTTHVTKEKALFAYSLCACFTGDFGKARLLGVAVDFLWLLSLVYDDIEDSDEARSGMPSVWKAYGILASQASLDVGFAKLLEYLTEKWSGEAAHVCDLLVKRSLHSVKSHKKMTLESTLEDLVANYRDRSAFHDQFVARMITLLLGNSAVASVNNAVEGLVFMNLAGQILNDLKDFTSVAWFGRTSYSDIRNGVVTVPVKMLCVMMSESDRALLYKVFGTQSADISSYMSRFLLMYPVIPSTKAIVGEYYARSRMLTLPAISDPKLAMYLEDWYEYKLMQVEQM